METKEQDGIINFVIGTGRPENRSDENEAGEDRKEE